MSAPLPKPARVKKWQRWSDRYDTERVVTDVSDIRAIMKDADGNLVGIPPVGMMDHWTFLGYAKPDKVEVGQRWRSKTCVYDVRRKMAHPRRDDVWELLGEDRVAMDSTETEIRGWEYLGMAERADGTKMHVGVDVAHGPDMTVRSVVTRDQLRDMDERHLEGLREHGQRAGIPTVEQARKDARRANEEAAKCLIANPPGWAYQKAWMCAVLALQERANVDDHRIFPASGDKICAEMLLEECKRAHNRQPRISGVVYDPIRDVLFDAYARGMERPYPLMGRPGVKGGVSTCDLGADYE